MDLIWKARSRAKCVFGQARMNRYGNVGSGSNLPNAEPSRSLHGSSFASGFGNGSSGWIWGGTAAVGSGTRKNGSVESGRNQGWSGCYRSTRFDVC